MLTFRKVHNFRNHFKRRGKLSVQIKLTLMKNSFLRNITLASLIFSVAIITSCGDDDSSTPAPEADFTTSIDGKTVTFTDASTDAETYAWEFGDGNTSTEASPTHTYETNGSYVAKLTVSNGSGEDSKQEVLEIINITIDGDFADWADVATAVEYTEGEGGTLTKMKLENLDNNKLYIYIEGTEDLGPLHQIFLNTDNDPTTGRQIEWRYLQPGEDYLIEGQILASENPEDQWYDLFQNNPASDPGVWDETAWQILAVTDFIQASTMVDISGGKAYEIAIDLSAFPTEISDEAIGVAVMSLVDWSEAGALPMYWNENDNPEGTMYTYTFK